MQPEYAALRCRPSHALAARFRRLNGQCACARAGAPCQAWQETSSSLTVLLDTTPSMGTLSHFRAGERGGLVQLHFLCIRDWIGNVS